MIKSWRNKKALTILAREKLKKDLKNNPAIFSKYYRPATNNEAVSRGYPLNKVRNGHNDFIPILVK